MILTRDTIIGLNDIGTKEIEIPAHIPEWGGNKVFIRQLSRGQQDEYMKRQFGAMRAKQDTRSRTQELTNTSIYGHDSWLCIQGICNSDGTSMFTAADEKMLHGKNGEAVGWLAKQIVEYSGMKEDVSVLQKAEDEIKNLQETQT